MDCQGAVSSGYIGLSRYDDDCDDTVSIPRVWLHCNGLVMIAVVHKLLPWLIRQRVVCLALYIVDYQGVVLVATVYLFLITRVWYWLLQYNY